LALLVSLPLAALAALDAGDHDVTLRLAGTERSYRVHVPPGGMERPWPVVLNLHGGGGNARGHQRYTRMDALADRERFLVVYPNGTGRFGDRLLTWNAGSCCGLAKDRGVDDVAFLRAVVGDLAERVTIDRTRIYATGLSNGAMMAYRLAQDASDLVAAIAPVAGAAVVEQVSATRPVPIMHIHSVDDPRALYDGGLGPPFPMTNVRVLHSPVEGMLAQWRRAESCPDSVRAGALLRGGPGNAHTATRLTWGPCRDGSEVVLWKLTGAGHVWPGGQLDYLTRVLGPGTDVIDANREMWEFFKRFTRDAR
jgi:polyhydroxybutyrate depolymerase